MKPVFILSEQQFLVQHKIMQVPYQAYSPDIIVCNFLLITQLRTHLNDKI